MNLNYTCTNLKGAIIVKIALIGATGFVGSYILKEAILRGHKVLAITRNPDKILMAPSVAVQKLDINDSETLVKTIIDCDIVIHAFAPPRSDSIEERIAKQTTGTKNII
ncbi:NAD-dependent epimerase/dehydratase family protein [Entomomonas moraniae]|uniref:NAD-dependent epimerase/dehydratase family protein n=1 Tax=Entomomonas moraniae TaxID=2213226 RepID=A0A3Q9JLS5_9GAMM|nr:NAD-dependent epimerase/dehydratase family protein [Entomomonas moraniae]